MDRNSRPRFRSSIDGFSRRPTPRSFAHTPVATHAYYASKSNHAPHPAAPVSVRPIAHHRPPVLNGEQPLINATQPNPSLSRQFSAPRPQRPRRRGWRFWKRGAAMKKKQRSRGRKVALSMLAVVGCLLLFGGYIGIKIIGDLDHVFHGNVASDAQALFSNVKLRGEAQGRVNVLVAGDSSDRVDPAANGGELTDSIMILSIDTKNNTAFMLSIPRDLWVNVPNEGWAKINSTYEYNGMKGLTQLIDTDFGIPIDYYALVNYQAFEDVVNAVGGINVNIQSSDPRGLNDPQPYPGASGFKLSNGWHELNGQEALDLARARGEGYGSYGFPHSDFDRTQHQRQMVMAIAQKGESAGVVANPIKVSQIFDALSSNVQTDLTLSDALEFVRLTKDIKISSIQSDAFSYTGSNPLLANYHAPDGQDALAPSAGPGDYTQLQNYYRQLTSSSPLVKEDASVVVLNASDAYGVARKEATILKNEGFNVTTVTDANGTYPSSMIIDESNGQEPTAKQALQQLFSSDTTTTTSTVSPAEATEAQGYTADFVIVLGQNWDAQGTSQTNGG